MGVIQLYLKLYDQLLYDQHDYYWEGQEKMVMLILKHM